MKLVIEQELAQQCLNAIAKLPYQDVFQLVPKLLQLPVLSEEASTETVDVAAVAQAASTQVAQEITTSN